MVASLQPENRPNSPNPHGHKLHHHKPVNGAHADASDDNRVLRVLIRRLGLSQTFGGNMIFRVYVNENVVHKNGDKRLPSLVIAEEVAISAAV